MVYGIAPPPPDDTPSTARLLHERTTRAPRQRCPSRDMVRTYCQWSRTEVCACILDCRALVRYGYGTMRVMRNATLHRSITAALAPSVAVAAHMIMAQFARGSGGTPGRHLTTQSLCTCRQRRQRSLILHRFRFRTEHRTGIRALPISKPNCIR